MSLWPSCSICKQPQSATDHDQGCPVFERINAAKNACYWRLHPMAHIDTSRGARYLYDAVCDLWLFITCGRGLYDQ